MVQISDAGLREWERDRMILRRQGHPDLPPDFDTPHFRAWDSDQTVGNNDVDKPARVTLRGDPSATVIGIWAAADHRTLVQGLLGRRPDGALVLDLKVGNVGAAKRSTVDGVGSLANVDQFIRGLALSMGLPSPSFMDEDAIQAELLDPWLARESDSRSGTPRRDEDSAST